MSPFAAALEIQSFCRDQGWRFCCIGGLAVQIWGEPRQTLDADLTILTGFGPERQFAETLLGRFAPRRPDALEFALRYRVLLLVSGDRIPIDVAFGAMPFEERAVARATVAELPDGGQLVVCSAEDLVVFKAFAGRDKDWLDIEGVAIRQGSRLDTRLIFQELEPLLELKEQPESARRLRDLLSRCAPPAP